jgi:hypothetical protein
MFDEILITVRNNQFHQIAFINNGTIEFVEPYEMKHHMEYLNMDITEFKFLQ